LIFLIQYFKFFFLTQGHLGNIMDSLLWVAAVAGYLLGAIPVSRVVGGLLGRNEELDSIEIPVSGTEETFKYTSTGAAAASMKLGPKIGCTIGLLDILKVFLPTLYFRLLYPEQYYFLVAATAGMVGHNWPVFRRFTGGRGISAAYGGLFVVDFFGAIICAATGLLFGLFVLRDFLLAYMAGLWIAIPWVWFTTRDPVYLSYTVIINILFILGTIPDLRQYIKVRRAGQIDMSTVMALTPMGRGMKKIMDRFNLMK
jgi:acyl phosphate:glycerol-3-phosphate acyltransferase